MDKEMNIYKVIRAFEVIECVMADDVIIDNHSSLIFRAKSQETNKFEPIYCLARGEWVGFKRISEKEMLELEQQEQEEEEEE